MDLMGMSKIFPWNTGPMTVYYLVYPGNHAHRVDLTAYARDTLPNLERTHTTASRTLPLPRI
ncbi:hypothetical protein EDB80DRAFT_739321 [Ilyonectria destructans]|nr:hypothetical protein EDB80DRAFT_739321 [Ilyonectria destructans]